MRSMFLPNILQIDIRLGLVDKLFSEGLHDLPNVVPTHVNIFEYRRHFLEL